MNVFVTGGAGFVGKRTIEHLRQRGARVFALVRRKGALDRTDVEEVVGDLLDPDTYRVELAQSDVVVHLAALTGKATVEEHDRTNRLGTLRLVEASREAGISRIVHVSTIAVAFPEHRHYPYARTKAAAEDIVRDSGLDHAIVRPTIVLGPGSPLWDKFVGLSSLPVVPLFGGGNARVNPVHVDDVAIAIDRLAAHPPQENATFEVGGRDILTMREFVRRIRRGKVGRDGPIVGVPIAPIIGALGLLSKVVDRWLPVGAGQFYAFRYDSAARTEPACDPPVFSRWGVEEMIVERFGPLEKPRSKRQGDDERGSGTRAALERECDTFCEYLVGQRAPALVRAQYVRAHERIPGTLQSAGQEDDLLVGLARRGPWFARLADTYASLFDSSGPLRTKLVLLFAMLESVYETNQIIDTPDPGGRLGFLFRLGIDGLRFAVRSVAAIFVVSLFQILGGGKRA